MIAKARKNAVHLSDETVRAISSAVRNAIADVARSGYEGIDKLTYGLGDAADMLCMDRTTLYRLSKTHPVYMPRERSNGLKRAVYSNHQLAAIKMVLLNDMPPDVAYKAFRKAERMEAAKLVSVLASEQHIART